MNLTIDLAAARFPVAPLSLNKILDTFVSSHYDSVTIISIDPLIRRCIEQRIEHRELPLLLDEHADTTAITMQDKQKWLETYYEEDFEDVDIKTHYLIKRRKVN